MLIRMDRIMPAEQVRTMYGFPNELFKKVQPCLPVFYVGDDGEPCYLESVVDDVLKRLAASLGTMPEPAHKSLTNNNLVAPVQDMESKLDVDRGTFSASYRGKPCTLGNTKEFRVLERLNQTSGKFVTYDDLIDDVWGDDTTDESTVQKTVSNLRRKLTVLGGVKIVSFRQA